VDMSRVKVFFMESEGNSFALPKVQDEIALTVRQSVDHLRNRSNCQIVNDFKFSELQNSFEIAGSTLFSLKDIPNPLKADDQNLALEVIKSCVGLSNYTFNLLQFYVFQQINKAFLSDPGYIKKNEYLKQLFMVKTSTDKFSGLIKTCRRNWDTMEYSCTPRLQTQRSLMALSYSSFQEFRI
jgi:hypothetical protein